MDTRTRWGSYAASKTQQKLAARKRQGERWRAASVAVVEQMERLWIDPEAAWRRWQAQE